MSLDKLYGKMKTHEMELEQKKIIYGSGAVDTKNAELLKTTALVASKQKELDITVEKPKSQSEMLFEAEMDDGNLSGDPSDYYTMEELHQMKDPTMANLAGMFSNIRFRRKRGFKGTGSSNRGQVHLQGLATRQGWLIEADSDASIVMKLDTLPANA